MLFVVVQLEEDLSGDLNLLIFLWTKYGSGKGCICHIEVVAKPPNMSLAGMKIRANNLMQTGNNSVLFSLVSIVY